ncbi:MAG: nucleotidyltransferase family protein [Deltaproteobacteria bacterium]|nr:nucleotidyltransferase family protein [Deltaproteobacteria bacterium]
MKAMILAAGLGTRLRSLTLNTPKALMPVGNVRIIDRIIEYLKQYGISELVINAHHHYEQIAEHLNSGRPFGINIDVRVEPNILGTGGGIKNTEDFWDKAPFIVINGDVLTNINLHMACEAHERSGSLATLILHDKPPFNQIKIDDQKNITHIAGENLDNRLAFTGIHIIDPEIMAHIPEGIFSNIIHCYRELIREGKPPKAYISAGHQWRDIGTIESYVLANKEALQGESFLCSPDCRINSAAALKDWAVIGNETVLEQGVEVCRSIIWEKVKVKKCVKIIDSIVTSSKDVEHDLIDEIF